MQQHAEQRADDCSEDQPVQGEEQGGDDVVEPSSRPKGQAISAPGRGPLTTPYRTAVP
ncbi:hypothetical protein ACGF0K_39285 [Streptomyces sp. NPDC048156]|uniref:hypothetical protein n=1 Tax=Streptomyces sp. NPDC048156 TaxID=3365502 RepID=UPI00371FD72E